MGGGWEPTLAEYKKAAGDSHASHASRVQGDGLLVKEVRNKFPTAKLRKVQAGEISSALFADYKVVTDFVVKEFGTNRLVDNLAADEFAVIRVTMAKRWGRFA